MADIKTLKDNETQVLPRTTSGAVMNGNGEPIENDINSISAPVENAANILDSLTGTAANDVSQSLVELQSIKSDLKAALTEKGQTVGDVFSEYPAAVRAIEAGGETAKVTINLNAPTSNTDPTVGIFYLSPDLTEGYANIDSAQFTLDVLKGSFLLPVLLEDVVPERLDGELRNIVKMNTDYGYGTMLIRVMGNGSILA